MKKTRLVFFVFFYTFMSSFIFSTFFSGDIVTNKEITFVGGVTFIGLGLAILVNKSLKQWLGSSFLFYGIMTIVNSFLIKNESVVYSTPELYSGEKFFSIFQIIIPNVVIFSLILIVLRFMFVDAIQKRTTK